MQGYIKAYRKMLGSTIWQDPDLFRLWMYCLMKASYKNRVVLIEKQEVELQAGEFVTGRFTLHQEFNQGIPPRKQAKDTTLWSWLKKLESLGNLDIKSFNKYSVVSIVNWNEYQESLTTEPQQNDSKLTAEPQQTDTNKNVKKEKNDKKEIKNSRKQVFDDTHYQLSLYFLEQIRKNNPDHKQPNLDTWSNDIRLMMVQDKRTEEQIKYLMKWVQEDSFECTNVLSPSKLRKRYDQLVMKVKQEKAKEKTPVKAGRSKEDFDLSE
ncbi:hypothetical protein HMPREF3291_05170 [Bacillus sp. HMSC76G11]|nr:hypothetical protein HMPREF3291_05170 [Bacillus sp. HMSC76G11]